MYNVTNSETLIIDRRRRGENQTVAAARWGVSQTLYSLWERNKHTDVPRVNVGRLNKLEVCFLKRRRGGFTQAQLARKLGYSEEWVKRMERGLVGSEPLINFWGI